MTENELMAARNCVQAYEELSKVQDLLGEIEDLGTTRIGLPGKVKSADSRCQTTKYLVLHALFRLVKGHE